MQRFEEKLACPVRVFRQIRVVQRAQQRAAHPRFSQHRQQPDTPRPDRDLGCAPRSSPRCTASAPPTGLFDGIYAVPPGAALLARDGRVKIRPYWDTDFPAAAELATDPRSGQSRANLL